MSKILLVVAAYVFVAVAVAAPAHAAWPSKVFSPYMQVDTGDNLQVTNVKNVTGQKYYTMAFVIADGSGNPTWGGTGQSVASGYYSAQINSLRTGGGDVIFSFGGAGGTELALTATDAAVLQSKYEAVISKYNATWLDFDIEGTQLGNTAKNQLRNTAIKALQVAHPGLQISFTLPADPDGLSSTSLALLTDAKNKGMQIRNVNAMTMDFGSFYSSGKTMSTVAISTANAVHADVNSIALDTAIGLTPMIGQNDVSTEVFQLSDATALLSFANANSWVDHIGMWSVNRDNGTVRNTAASDLHSGIVQNPWDFTNTFKAYVPEPASLSLLLVAPLFLRRRR